MNKNIGRYSKYLRPLTILFDLGVLNLLIYFFLSNEFASWSYCMATSIIWVFCAFITKFYEVYRFTKIIQIGEKTLKQFFLFAVFSFAYFGFFAKQTSNREFIEYLITCAVVIVLFKILIFNLLKIFRKYFKGNQRRVVIVGNGFLSKELAKFFLEELDYGYQLLKHFDNGESANDVIKFCNNEKIEELYVSLSCIDNKDLNSYIVYSDNNFKTLKYIPSKREILSASSKAQFYGYIPLIPSRKFPLQDMLFQIQKRVFDLVVSSLVIVFVLSWLVPLVGLLIKLESRGPIFFNQVRNGLFYQEFSCFKFRSMFVNEEAHTLQATKNDKRITKVGRFLRKTSLDEMPQFFNVFIGNMSVCGPRPHMISLTNEYELTVEKFKLRHYIKPGITGMAQTHGYRGEIESNRDIVNRVKYDIFYMENWTLLLDMKIVYLTIKNAVLGDKKAY